MDSTEDDVLAPEYLKRIVLDLTQMSEFVQDPLIMAKADGVWYEDVNGKRYLDGISGIFVVTVGHNNRRIIEAMRKQLDTLAFSPPMHSTNTPAVQLVKLISEITPGDLNTVKLLSGGSEATEAAMKLARQYHNQTGNPGKYKIISRYLGYHGATFGALSASGTQRRKRMFEPTLSGFIHVFPPTCYRCPFEKEYPSCEVLCASIIEDTIKLEGPSTVAAIIMEPIGNTGGIVTPPPEYFPMVREICDKHDILLIFDEIITGFGRTGEMFAAQTFHTTPDIICMGKGMSSGYAPLAAIAMSDKVASAFWGKPEDEVEFSHGHTYGGNPVASAAGIASISEITEKDLPKRARQMGAYLWSKLENLRDKTGIIGDIRGKGLFLGVEFVVDTATKERFSDDLNFGTQVGKKAIKNGLLTRFDPHWIAFGPPLIVTEEEIDYMMDVFEKSIYEVLDR